MKGTCTLVASMLAASTVAFSAGDSHSSSSRQGSNSTMGKQQGASSSSSDKEKFAPRFDGLRFIETLVTAHR